SNVILEGEGNASSDLMLVQSYSGNAHLYYCELLGAAPSRLSSMVRDPFGQWQLEDQFDLPFSFFRLNLLHLGTDDIPDLIGTHYEDGEYRLYALVNMGNSSVAPVDLGPGYLYELLDVDLNGYRDVIYKAYQSDS